MVTEKVHSLNTLRKINGIGEGRVSKYGEQFVTLLNETILTHDAQHNGNEQPSVSQA